MRLKSLKLENFRNYEQATLEFAPKVNIIIGDNGMGKTSILEAIYILALTKSNRNGIDSDLIKYESNLARVNGDVIHDDVLKNYQVEIDRFGKRVFINKNQIKKISEYISNFCVVSFAPNDIEIIKGSPSIRRNNLNIQIGSLYNNYVKNMNDYNSLLKIRNEYLKRLNISGLSDKKYLDVINQKMSDLSVKIYYFRFFYLEEVNKIIGTIFKKISGLDGLTISFQNSVGIDSYDEEKIRRNLLRKWENNYQKELMQGMTLTGLHRDDLLFLLNGKDAKIYASQGQQRMIVIAYKIAELMIYKKIKGEYPVFLLDDVFSEIDIKKRNNIIKYFKNDMQVIITTTDIEDIETKLMEDARIYKITNGVIKITKGGVRNGRRKSTRKL